MLFYYLLGTFLPTCVLLFTAAIKYSTPWLRLRMSKKQWGLKQWNFMAIRGAGMGFDLHINNIEKLCRIVQIYDSFFRFLEYNRKVHSKSNKIYVVCRLQGKNKAYFSFSLHINLLAKKFCFPINTNLLKYIISFQLFPYVFNVNFKFTRCYIIASESFFCWHPGKNIVLQPNLWVVFFPVCFAPNRYVSGYNTMKSSVIWNKKNMEKKFNFKIHRI